MGWRQVFDTDRDFSRNFGKYVSPRYRLPMDYRGSPLAVQPWLNR